MYIHGLRKCAGKYIFLPNLNSLATNSIGWNGGILWRYAQIYCLNIQSISILLASYSSYLSICIFHLCNQCNASISTTKSNSINLSALSFNLLRYLFSVRQYYLSISNQPGQGNIYLILLVFQHKRKDILLCNWRLMGGGSRGRERGEYLGQGGRRGKYIPPSRINPSIGFSPPRPTFIRPGPRSLTQLITTREIINKQVLR